MTNYNKVNDKKEEKTNHAFEDDRDKYESVYPGKLNFRKEPGGEILFEMKQGERMFYTGITEEYDGVDWLSMEARGQKGFVMARYVEKV